MDEARFGQQGSVSRKWAPTGTRPTAVKQTKYEWVYMYAAVEPATGESTALIAPNVNTGTMNAFLRMLSDDVVATGSEDDVAVVIMDQAGWHTSKDLEVPDNILILLLPPYSPELNPIENLWHWMKSHYTSNRTYKDYDDLRVEIGAAWRKITKARFRSVCRAAYIEHAIRW